VLVCSDTAPSARLRYAADLIFVDLLHSDEVVHFLPEDPLDVFYEETNWCLWYAATPPPDDRWVHVVPHGLLSATDTAPVADLHAVEKDPLAAVFWLATHYAAYDPSHPKDEHGRPKQARLPSWPDPYDPVCHRLAYSLGEALEDRVRLRLRPCLSVRVVRMAHSLDIDNAYAFAGKGPVRWTGSLIKDIASRRWDWVAKRLAHVLGRAEDPFDTHELILNTLPKNNLRVFFLMSDQGRYDRALSPTHPDFKRLVRLYTEQAFMVGIHPSYAGGQNDKSLAYEKGLLAELADHPIGSSRHHYLRTLTPYTQRLLIRQGIRHDYIGSPEPGFWQGISANHAWFDVEQNSITRLVMHPAAWMDAHWINHPEEGLAAIRKLKERLDDFGGRILLIWHNDYFRRFAELPGFVVAIC